MTIAVSLQVESDPAKSQKVIANWVQRANTRPSSKREGDGPLSLSHRSTCGQNYDDLFLNLLNRPKDRLDHLPHGVPTSRTTLPSLETRRQFLGPRSQTALPRSTLLFEMEHHGIAHSFPDQRRWIPHDLQLGSFSEDFLCQADRPLVDLFRTC